MAGLLKSFSMTHLVTAYFFLTIYGSQVYSNAVNKNMLTGFRKLSKRQHDYTLPENACLSLPQLEAFKAQFSAYIDSNDDGKATYQEVENYLRKYNPHVTKEEINEFVHRRDTDGDGEIDFIPDYLTELLTPTYSTSKAKEWFDLEDVNNDGYITKTELIQIAINVGMSEQEAEETALSYYMSADTNQDGRLDWNEYSKLATE